MNPDPLDGLAARVIDDLESVGHQVRPDALPVSDTRWIPADLDRCEHGRHSIDPCADCPGGQSTGNRFLWGLTLGHHAEMTARAAEGLVRIGTTVRGEPIYVRPIREARRAE
jgi:hypothetical protein